MCGIAGLIRFDADLDRDTLEACARRMADTLRPRGPDADGYHVDPSVGLALAHRRLSIVDLSAAGAQPMTSRSGRLTVVFNGEIYDHEAMRAALPGRAWRGHSDTEVLLEAIDAWGLEEALRRAVGMFALALWDADKRALSFARDRMGEKPLYYGLIDGALAFGSELKALRAAIGWRGTIDRVALDDLMRHGNVHGPRSIFDNVRKLPAGTTLTVPLARGARSALTPTRYSSLSSTWPSTADTRPPTIARPPTRSKGCSLRPSTGSAWPTCRWARSSRAAWALVARGGAHAARGRARGEDLLDRIP